MVQADEGFEHDTTPSFFACSKALCTRILESSHLRTHSKLKLAGYPLRTALSRTWKLFEVRYHFVIHSLINTSSNNHHNPFFDVYSSFSYAGNDHSYRFTSSPCPTYWLQASLDYLRSISVLPRLISPLSLLHTFSCTR